MYSNKIASQLKCNVIKRNQYQWPKDKKSEEDYFLNKTYKYINFEHGTCFSYSFYFINKIDKLKFIL